MTTPWWKHAVIYQIYPRSFCDSNGDGIGDLPGITSQLDHLAWLGVDAIWLSPFFRSPMHDFGYDVSDYCDVDPIFGTLADFDVLIERAHGLGMKVMIDWVPGHTSTEHPWFIESRSSRDNPKRNWYVWKDAKPSGDLPNNWQAAFLRKPAWTFDEHTGQYYLHSFLAEQADLNWNEPAVVEAMLATLRFWLNRGVDGFRADVVHNIGKSLELEDVPDNIVAIPHCALNDEAVTHEHLRAIRKVIDEYPGDRAIVGEVFLLSTEKVVPYYGNDDELHMNFNFPPLYAPWEAEAWRGHIEDTLRNHDPVDAWPTWVLSNHDQRRHRTRYGCEERSRAAATLLLGLKGTPFLYMGEELGLEDAHVPEDRVVDPGGRDPCRAPLPWLREEGHGWPSPPWLPWPPDPRERSVEHQLSAAESMLHHYRNLLTERRATESLRIGGLQLLDAPEGTLIFERRHGDEVRHVAINFTEEVIALPKAFESEVRVSSSVDRGQGLFCGKLQPLEAVILEPA